MAVLSAKQFGVKMSNSENRFYECDESGNCNNLFTTGIEASREEREELEDSVCVMRRLITVGNQRNPNYVIEFNKDN